MARTSFFLATDDELATVLRGWKRAAPLLDQPITMTMMNPLTNEARQFRTWIEGELPQADPDAVTSGDLHDLPCIDQEGMLTTDVVDLASIVMQWDLDRADSEVHGRLLAGPLAATAAVCEMPPELVARLAQLSGEELVRYGRFWAARVPAAEAMGGVVGIIRGGEAARSDTEWIMRLLELAELAQRAVAEDRGMFLCLSL
jgi:hypothetical protein